MVLIQLPRQSDAQVMSGCNTKVLAAVVLMLLAGACSVKENRDPCPCALMLDFSRVDSLCARKIDVLVSSVEGFMLADTVDVVFNGGIYRADVPRTDLHVRAWAGAGEAAAGESILIPLGQDCPRVYMSVADIETEGEVYTHKVRMCKNHCVMTLVTEGEGEFRHDLYLEGSVCGYGRDGIPEQGQFKYLLKDEDLQDGYQAVLPRQTDGSLMLKIDDGDGRYFALGQYIISSGYDWTAEDLEDITVTIDYASTMLRLVIDGWESEYTYEFEI